MALCVSTYYSIPLLEECESFFTRIQLKGEVSSGTAFYLASNV